MSQLVDMCIRCSKEVRHWYSQEPTGDSRTGQDAPGCLPLTISEVGGVYCCRLAQVLKGCIHLQACVVRGHAGDHHILCYGLRMLCMRTASTLLHRLHRHVHAPQAARCCTRSTGSTVTHMFLRNLYFPVCKPEMPAASGKLTSHLNEASTVRHNILGSAFSHLQARRLNGPPNARRARPPHRLHTLLQHTHRKWSKHTVVMSHMHMIQVPHHLHTLLQRARVGRVVRSSSRCCGKCRTHADGPGAPSSPHPLALHKQGMVCTYPVGAVASAACCTHPPGHPCAAHC